MQGMAIGRNTNTTSSKVHGSIKPGVLVFIFFFLAGGIYLYSLNASAVQGYQIREVETEMGKLRKENEQLKIKEAELKSLYYIEESSRKSNMGEFKEVSYVVERGPVAMRR